MSDRRRPRGFLLGFFALMACLTLGAQAQPVATLIVADAEAEVDQTVEVTVRAENVQQGIVGIQGRLNFDPSVLRIVEVTFHEAFKVTSFNALDDQGVLYFVGTLVQEGEEPVGLFEETLFTFQAQAVGAPGTSSPLDATFELVKNLDHEVLQVEVRDGTFTIGAANQPPQADFSFTPERPGVNETVTFLDASTDPDGRIVRWLWDFGDGERLEVQTASQQVTHAYRQPGPYEVTLTVIDDRDAQGTVTKTVVVGPERGEPEIFVFPNPCGGPCTFRYRVPEEATAATLRIYNVRGALVRSVALDLGRDAYRWDLRDDAGAPVPNGPYFFFMIVESAGGVRRTPVDVLVIQR